MSGLVQNGSPLFPYGVLCLAVLSLVGLLAWTDDPAFRPFLGPLPPLGAFAGVAALGGALLAKVLARAGFAVVRRNDAGGWVRATWAATAFGAVVVAVDFFLIRFPRDMNVPFPRSLAFYPAIGFLVEILFHVLPLSVALVSLALVTRPKNRDRLVWVALAATALIEPAYQTLKPWAGQTPGTTVFVAVHVAAINVVGLWLLRRYDFFTMYGFRVVYYLIWHVGWGAWRLRILA